MGEILVIASQKLFANALLRLRDLAKKRGQQRGTFVAREDELVGGRRFD